MFNFKQKFGFLFLNFIFFVYLFIGMILQTHIANTNVLSLNLIINSKLNIHPKMKYTRKINKLPPVFQKQTFFARSHLSILLVALSKKFFFVSGNIMATRYAVTKFEQRRWKVE